MLSKESIKQYLTYFPKFSLQIVGFPTLATIPALLVIVWPCSKLYGEINCLKKGDKSPSQCVLQSDRCCWLCRARKNVRKQEEIFLHTGVAAVTSLSSKLYQYPCGPGINGLIDFLSRHTAGAGSIGVQLTATDTTMMTLEAHPKV